MPQKLVIFKANWCGHCREQVPKAEAIANRLGIQSEVVDIDACPITKEAECKTIEFVPTMKLDGSEVSLEQLEARLNGK